MKTSRLLPLVLSVASWSSSGCSWLFVQPLPAHYERGDTVNCTSNRAAPVIDTIFTLTNVASAVYVAGQDNVTNKNAAVGLGLAVAGLWVSSAIYGYSKTSECEVAMEDDAPSPRYRRPVSRRPVAPPAAPSDNWAPSVTVQPTAAPTPTPAPQQPGSGSPAQQQDEDEPGAARAKHPLPDPKPEDPGFGN